MRVTYDVEKIIEPFYTGGAVALNGNGTIFATSLGDDAILTNPNTGQRLARIEGVSGTTLARRKSLD